MKKAILWFIELVVIRVRFSRATYRVYEEPGNWPNSELGWTEYTKNRARWVGLQTIRDHQAKPTPRQTILDKRPREKRTPGEKIRLSARTWRLSRFVEASNPQRDATYGDID